MKDRLKDIFYRRISNLGAALTPQAYSAGLEMASHLRALFARFQINCVFDVGANEGQYRNFLRRRCGYTGEILSFEPVRQTFTVLQNRASRDPKWRVFNFALGAANEAKTFHVMTDTRLSSFLEPQASGCSSLDHSNVMDHHETATVRRLDTLISELAAQHDFSRVYLKMDTQGYDLVVMAGLGAETKRIVALQSEISVKPIYQRMPNYSESLHQLSERGFEVTGLFPVIRDELYRVIEFDCVAINTKLAMDYQDGKKR